MSTRMLIDARHPEETRVAVIRGNRVEEFDYESVAKQQLKGNIYLAKVTRVEPSLQACFVEYGGNRHGFLAFSEIHPDYYQIPVADREALLAAEAEAAQAEAAEADVDAHEGETRPVKAADEDGEESEVEEVAGDEDTDEEASERRRLRSLRRRYKIQEVIKRRQILLVQVVKEERGSKGAALTTYLSLAGRYCVLMPNSFNGGGISRKIANQADRKKLKSVLSALDIPEGMGCIIRTAGLNRTKAEIKRDFDYLLRLWDEIRDRTLHSIAPALIHEEANLIRRSIRDLYSRDIDEVLVEGEEGYRTAKEFMKLLTPSHAKRVKHYKDRIPLFFRYQVESQLEAMYSPVVQLPSGGYLVIDPTEALVSIDVNSGRSTKEHNIEETALKTNLEAAEEIARQLRLRDLAGLIVIDFIDMEERGNNRKVEKRLKEALRHDRARIQMGRISTFGLLEMSRQRLRPNILEASMTPCPTCGGAGVVRSIESAALAVLRALEEEGIQGRSEALTVHAPGEVTSYILNQKRGILADFERQYDLRIAILPEEDLGTEPFRLECEARSEPRKPAIEAPEPAAAVEESEPAQADAAPDGEAEESAPRKRRRRRRRGRRGRGEDKVVATAGSPDAVEAPGKDTSEESTPTEAAAATDAQQADETGEAPARRPRRRRRKAAKESGEAAAAVADGTATEPAEIAVTADEAGAAAAETADESAAPQAPAAAEEKPRRRRVRRKKSVAADTGSEEPQTATADDAGSDSATPAAAAPQTGTTKDVAAEAETPARPRRRRTSRSRKAAADAASKAEAIEVSAADAPEPAPAEPAPAPVTKADGDTSEAAPVATPAPAPETKPEAPRRRGWWQRAVGK